jgi:aspartate aminotransferase
VLVPSPYWVSYIEIIKLAEGKSIIVPTKIENDFKVTPEQLEKAITKKTKLLIFSSPCNPTGSVYNKNELKAIAEMLLKYPDIYILSDEIYEHINFVGGHECMAQFDFIKDRVVTVNGVSKSYAMTGWRVGFMAASLPIAKACDKMQGQFTSATCSIAQKAAHAAVELDTSSIYPMRDQFLKRRDLVLKSMNEIPGLKTNIPQGAFYVFPDVTYYFGRSDGKNVIKNATDLCSYMLDKGHVAIVPGAAFGDDNYIRFSYATSETKLVEALKRMKSALSELK